MVLPFYKIMLELATRIVKKLGHKIQPWKADPESLLWEGGFSSKASCAVCGMEFGTFDTTHGISLTVMWRTRAGVLSIKLSDLKVGDKISDNFINTIEDWFICDRLKVFV